MTPVFSGTRAAARMLLFLIATLLCMALFSTARRTGPANAVRVRRFWFAFSNRLIGLHVRHSGTIPPVGPTLYVANHVSYLDVMALGGLLDASFVAKSEVGEWPLFGRIAALGDTLFVSRKASRVRQEADAIRTRLAAGKPVILFPEGTSSIGEAILPFRPALFGFAFDIPGLRIQPISLAYIDPRHGDIDPHPAWYGDMSLLPHLWSVMTRGAGHAHIHFHETVTPADYENRKSLASACHRVVADGLAQLRRDHILTSPVAAADESCIWDAEPARPSTPIST